MCCLQSLIKVDKPPWGSSNIFLVLLMGSLARTQVCPDYQKLHTVHPRSGEHAEFSPRCAMRALLWDNCLLDHSASVPCKYENDTQGQAFLYSARTHRLVGALYWFRPAKIWLISTTLRRSASNWRRCPLMVCLLKLRMRGYLLPIFCAILLYLFQNKAERNYFVLLRINSSGSFAFQAKYVWLSFS